MKSVAWGSVTEVPSPSHLGQTAGCTSASQGSQTVWYPGAETFSIYQCHKCPCKVAAHCHTDLSWVPRHHITKLLSFPMGQQILIIISICCQAVYTAPTLLVGSGLFHFYWFTFPMCHTNLKPNWSLQRRTHISWALQHLVLWSLCNFGDLTPELIHRVKKWKNQRFIFLLHICRFSFSVGS